MPCNRVLYNRARRKILFTEGSSLSARQTLYALGPQHQIDVCDPNPNFCLARFSRFVCRCYRCPRFAADPMGFLEFLVERVRAEHYDVVFPVHDQIYLLSKFRARLEPWTTLPVPEFSAVERVQSKPAFLDLLGELGLPHPATQKIHRREELAQQRQFPFYLKLPYSTAGCGVWRIESGEAARLLGDRLDARGHFRSEMPLLIQEPATGVLAVTQCVFQRGRLLAAHIYQARALGVGGSASARVSIQVPEVVDHLRTLGQRLSWHGALMIDFFIDPANGRISYLEANPRIGETMNALLSGVNLPELLLKVALGEQPVAAAPRAGTRTHSLVMGLMALAQGGGTRINLLAELFRAAARRGVYAHSTEELTCPSRDVLSMVPAAFLTAQLLIKPSSAEQIVNRAVNDYALGDPTIKAINEARS